MNRVNIHPMRDARWWSRAVAPSPEWQFFSKVGGSGRVEDCWPWLANSDHAGYGTFITKGRRFMAHRWAYQHLVATIPTGLQLDHLCRNRACVNPWHLDPVTPRVNSARRQPRAVVAA